MGSWPAFFLRLFYYYYYYYLYHSRNGEPTLPVHQWAFAIRNEQGFAFLPLLPPLVNLLINNDCKPDNAVFAIFILLPLSLHATPSTLSLYTYVYTYSIDFHSKTNVYLAKQKLRTTLSDWIRRIHLRSGKIKKIFDGAFNFTNCLSSTGENLSRYNRRI